MIDRDREREERGRERERERERDREKRRDREKDLNQKFCMKQFLSDLFFSQRDPKVKLYTNGSQVGISMAITPCVFLCRMKTNSVNRIRKVNFAEKKRERRREKKRWIDRYVDR